MTIEIKWVTQCRRWGHLTRWVQWGNNDYITLGWSWFFHPSNTNALSCFPSTWAVRLKWWDQQSGQRRHRHPASHRQTNHGPTHPSTNQAQWHAHSSAHAHISSYAAVTPGAKWENVLASSLLFNLIDATFCVFTKCTCHTHWLKHDKTHAERKKNRTFESFPILKHNHSADP